VTRRFQSSIGLAGPRWFACTIECRKRSRNVGREEDAVMSRRIGLIGVPSSAGAHWPGQEKAPRALREAGLVERLESAGLVVVDHGDLPRVRFRPNPEHRNPQNLEAVAELVRCVADRVVATLRAGEIPLVIGGDCTIELGVLSGFLRAGQDPALLYLDGGVDLRTPATNPTGILDSMGVAHMVGEPGAAEELARIGPRFPLMEDERVVLFGYEPNPPEIGVLEQHSMLRYPAKIVRDRPREAAAEALARLEEEAERFVVHFDVDVIDFVDFPIADVPQHNAGLTFKEAIACLEVFASSPHFAGLTITEFNPDHADEEGVLAATFASEVAVTLGRQGTEP
jgi:arginase